jgi:phytoene dehydrogenase-like protein
VRVAVVGAGIGGCVAADAISSRLGPEARIVVFEREGRVGGRMLDREIAGVRVETGATLYHSSNRLVAGLAAELALEPVDVSGRPQTVGVRDGDRLVLRTRASRLDALRMLVRYRGSLPRAARAVKSAVARLEAVYERLDAGETWPGPRELLADLGLAELCDERADDYLARLGVGGRFVREFADGVSRNNYGQHAGELSAFVDLVSLAGAGLGGGSLHRVKGGNAQLARGLIERSGAELRLGAGVARIARAENGWQVGDEGFDAVVLAAPLELSGVELRGPQPPAARSYKEIHATFVAGRRSGPDFMLTTEACGPLLSVETVATRGDGPPLHKVFTREALPESELDRLFESVESVETVETVEWRAYPELPPMSSWAPFELGPGVYYPSAMEYAVSTMETQAIAGRAVANLLADRVAAL